MRRKKEVLAEISWREKEIKSINTEIKNRTKNTTVYFRLFLEQSTRRPNLE